MKMLQESPIYQYFFGVGIVQVRPPAVLRILLQMLILSAFGAFLSTKF